MTVFVDYLQTPLGLFEFMANDHVIFQSIFCGNIECNKRQVRVNHITKACKEQLIEYFSGQRHYFDLPIAPKGTSFQQSVWHCLKEIPYGAVKSYGQIAQQINKPNASQAVGGANGRNPITLIIPCHRVIGSNGSMVGYAGGIERKLWLLNHEGVKLNETVNSAEFDLTKAIGQRQMKTRFLR